MLYREASSATLVRNGQNPNTVNVGWKSKCTLLYYTIDHEFRWRKKERKMMYILDSKLDLGRCLPPVALTTWLGAGAVGFMASCSVVTRGDDRGTRYHMVVANLSPDGLRIYVSSAQRAATDPQAGGRGDYAWFTLRRLHSKLRRRTLPLD